MNIDDVIKLLESLFDPISVKGMERFGIKPLNNYGITVSKLREIAKKIGKNHDLAIQLWDTGIRDARILAALIEIPKLVSEEQMEKWVNEFDSWDICDHCCGNLFDKTEFAFKKAFDWSNRNDEYVKRASFALMAWSSVHNKNADDSIFEDFLMVIKREAFDERNYVKKSVNWALRQIGKRNLYLNNKAIKIANDIHKFDSKSAKWIARDAIRELTNEKTVKRLNNIKN
jgi:3-methyladenine DNA glycosylase AlkD